MPKTTQQHSAERRAKALQRAVGGRKRVDVGSVKWNHPQTITTLQRVPLPPQRVSSGRRRTRRLMRFSEFVGMLE